jgi:hypothetical protein
VVLAKDPRLLAAVCGLVLATTMLTHVTPAACTAFQEGYVGGLGGSPTAWEVCSCTCRKFWGGRSLLTYALVADVPPLAAQAGLGMALARSQAP